MDLMETFMMRWKIDTMWRCDVTSFPVLFFIWSDTHLSSIGMNSKNIAFGWSRYLLWSSIGQMFTPMNPSVAAYNGEYAGVPANEQIR